MENSRGAKSQFRVYILTSSYFSCTKAKTIKDVPHMNLILRLMYYICINWMIVRLFGAFFCFLFFMKGNANSC